MDGSEHRWFEDRGAKCAECETEPNWLCSYGALERSRYGLTMQYMPPIAMSLRDGKSGDNTEAQCEHFL